MSNLSHKDMYGHHVMEEESDDKKDKDFLLKTFKPIKIMPITSLRFYSVLIGRKKEIKLIVITHAYLKPVKIA